MAGIAMGAAARVESGGPRAPRLLFVDNIRWSMILLVLSMHASDTYSPFGNWYYVDRQPAGLATKLFFGIYQSFLQAFFMALLFFVAGYFSAAACDRKGVPQFVRDRFIRLGLPTLLYMLAIGPLTQYFLSRTWGSGGFAHQWWVHLMDGEWLSETGPMWFCAVLLLFSILYGVFRLTGWKEGAVKLRDDRWATVALFIVIMAALSFLVRIAVSDDRSVLNVHPGDLPQHILMYAAGVLGYRGKWLTQLPDGFCLRLAALALSLSVPLFAVLLFGGLKGDTSQFAGGFNAISGGKCLWEALVCVGMAFMLFALFRRYFDSQGPFAETFSENAFGIYLIHPPILIACAILLHPLPAHPIAKAALLTALAAIGSLAASALILRRSPLRSII